MREKDKEAVAALADLGKERALLSQLLQEKDSSLKLNQVDLESLHKQLQTVIGEKQHLTKVVAQLSEQVQTQDRSLSQCNQAFAEKSIKLERVLAKVEELRARHAAADKAARGLEKSLEEAKVAHGKSQEALVAQYSTEISKLKETLLQNVNVAMSTMQSCSSTQMEQLKLEYIYSF